MGGLADLWIHGWGGWANWAATWQLDFGSVGEWAGALGTAGAVFAAFRIANKEKDEREDRDRELLRDQQIQEYKRQRAQVEAVRFSLIRLHGKDEGDVDGETGSDPVEYGLAVFNATDYPISNVNFRVEQAIDEEDVNRTNSNWVLTAQGEAVKYERIAGPLHLMSGDSDFRALESHQYPGDNIYAYVLEFEDVGGRGWTLTLSGPLLRVYANPLLPDMTDEYFSIEAYQPTVEKDGPEVEFGLYSKHTGKPIREAKANVEQRTFGVDELFQRRWRGRGESG